MKSQENNLFKNIVDFYLTLKSEKHVQLNDWV